MRAIQGAGERVIMATEKALSELFIAIVDALAARGRKGPGMIVEKFGPITVKMNATEEERESIPPFCAIIFEDELSEWLPAAIINFSDGQIMRGTKTEDELIEFFRGQK